MAAKPGEASARACGIKQPCAGADSRSPALLLCRDLERRQKKGYCHYRGQRQEPQRCVGVGSLVAEGSGPHEADTQEECRPSGVHDEQQDPE